MQDMVLFIVKKKKNRHTNFQHQQPVKFQCKSSTSLFTWMKWKMHSSRSISWIGLVFIDSWWSQDQIAVNYNPKHITYTLKQHRMVLSDRATWQFDFNLCEVVTVLSCCDTDPVTFCWLTDCSLKVDAPSGSKQLCSAYSHLIYTLTIGSDSAELNGDQCGLWLQDLIIPCNGQEEGREVDLRGSTSPIRHLTSPRALSSVPSLSPMLLSVLVWLFYPESCLGHQATFLHMHRLNFWPGSSTLRCIRETVVLSGEVGLPIPTATRSCLLQHRG